jgi:poly-beta-1,6-N-acetyl-D-glucosamine synthase
MRYVLATAAYNEEAFIERTLESVVAQTVRPEKWIIVSDGSTDRTDEIVGCYAAAHEFIQLQRITEAHPRNFAAQVHAINTGFSLLSCLEYDFIGNLDADITLAPTYFARLLEKFDADPGLGLAGGCIYEERNGGGYFPRRSNSTRSVAHALQLFRRECMDTLGAYAPLPYGGPDWHAEVCARMNGWRVESFPELRALHHRPTGNAEGKLRSWRRAGLMDFSMGTHPLFEVFKLARRLPERPAVIGAIVRLAAFLWAGCRGKDRPVAAQFVRFLRAEQMQRLRAFWSR